MSNEHESLTALVEFQKQRIGALEKELQQLRALKSTEPTDRKKEDGDIKMEETAMDGQNSNGLEAYSDTERMVPMVEYMPDIVGEPIWYGDDGIYRCSVCIWEIVERRCEGCNRDYSGWVCEENPDSELLEWNDDVYHDRRSDENYRASVPRGSTPLLDLDPARLRPDTVAYEYVDRIDEYRNLLARGATRMMCETFYLTYSEDSGIWLEMKDDLLDEWAGPIMLNSGSGLLSWKVCLGREIRLDGDGSDQDGSHYIEEFLEEALLFGGRTSDEAVEPYHNDTGIRMLGFEYIGWEEDWADIKEVAKNDYDSDNPGDEDEECPLSDDQDGKAQLGWDGEGGYGPDGSRGDEENKSDSDELMDDEPDSEGDSFDSDWDSQDEEHGDEA
uniref:Uncharacterized protein n=1 Tax=Moniliophthora roreri TaxID=221103 RepID=A0A0W0GAT4_MONRR